MKFVFSFQGLLVLLPERRAKPLKALLQVFTVTWLLKHIPASLTGGCFVLFFFFFELRTSCNLMSWKHYAYPCSAM